MHGLSTTNKQEQQATAFATFFQISGRRTPGISSFILYRIVFFRGTSLLPSNGVDSVKLFSSFAPHISVVPHMSCRDSSCTAHFLMRIAANVVPHISYAKYYIVKVSETVSPHIFYVESTVILHIL